MKRRPQRRLDASAPPPLQNLWTKVDPEGLWGEDLVLGVPSILLGGKSFYDNAKSGNVGGAAVDAVGILTDVCAVALPGIPGGAGFGIKAARMAGKVDDALNTGQALIEAGKALKDGDIVRAGTSAATALAGGKHLVDAKKLEAVGDANKATKKLSGSDVGESAHVTKNHQEGLRRQDEVAQELAAENPGKVVQGERLLRDETGKKVVDPVTGQGRRVDHAVIDRDKGTARTYETTGNAVDKTVQLEKEQRVRDAGGRYIRDKETRKMVEVEGVSEVKRKD